MAKNVTTKTNKRKIFNVEHNLLASRLKLSNPLQ